MLRSSLVVVSFLIGLSLADPMCRFAAQFTADGILTNPIVREQFLLHHVNMEKHFIRSLGIDNSTGMTLDGQRLDVKSGQPFGPPHLFSAPSKESIHVGLLALALLRNPIASQLFTVAEALALLKQKVASYNRFNEQFPGFGGFFPWTAFDLKGNVTPTWDWQNKVPALDNGELFWAAFAVAGILKAEFMPEQAELQQAWEAVWNRMVNNSLTVFYAGNGTLRTVTLLTNQSLPVSQNKYWGTPGEQTLNDPYEGELFTVMVYLFTNLPNEEKQMLWVQKRAMLQKASLVVNSSSFILVEKGFWFSAHEKWKYLMLPYQNSPTNWKVFLNGERARTQYAAQIEARGLWASVTGTASTNQDVFQYFSDCGVQEISFNKVTHDAIVTPYGAFPLFMADRSVGAAWLHHMLLARQGQNCYGSTESMNISGVAVSPMTTWDSKATTVLASAGGLSSVVRNLLKERNLMDNFTNIVESEWNRVFPSTLPGANFPFAAPAPENTIPEILDDFTTCSIASPPCSYN